MYNNLINSILIAFVVTNVHDGTRIRATPSIPLFRPQLELVAGVFKQQHWRNSWFTFVNDGEDWLHVDHLLNPYIGTDAWDKLRMIPQMMGCMYGVKFYWFLSLAINVIGECKELSQQQNANSKGCWNKLNEGLQKGSDTISEVIRSLLYTRSTIGYINVDVFYQIMLVIQNTLGLHSAAAFTVVLEDGNNYVSLVESHFVTLHSLLTSYCKPDGYPQLNLVELMFEFEQRFPGAKRHVYYVYIMKYYMEEVSAHLFEMGFRYDSGTDQTTFINPL